MKNDNVKKIEQLYKDGYKCIRYEKNSEGKFVAYFKNFEEETSEELFSYDEFEISNIKDFIDNQ